ncbi:hypothetical protein LY78DRAFT_222938 [Colletotrichum sublineola]|nr:hypothetical protein LY78DRAFT_222938 [Colletotrichum sublineola]
MLLRLSASECLPLTKRLVVSGCIFFEASPERSDGTGLSRCRNPSSRPNHPLSPCSPTARTYMALVGSLVTSDFLVFNGLSASFFCRCLRRRHHHQLLALLDRHIVDKCSICESQTPPPHADWTWVSSTRVDESFATECPFGPFSLTRPDVLL